MKKVTLFLVFQIAILFPLIGQEPAAAVSQVPKKTLKKPLKKRFMPTKDVANSNTYYEADFSTIRAFDIKMQEDINFGGLEGTPFHLQAGNIFFYKTTKNNWGKLQILSFGQLDTVSELYIRWTTFDEKGKLVTTTELGENVTSKAASRFEDLDGSAFAGYDFYWEIKNDLLFIKARKDAKFYLLKNNESITVPEDNTPSAAQQNSTAATISWQHPLSNNSTTSDATVELKACVETSETVREYILIQNGQKLSIARGLIPRKANDCLNAFTQTVTLKNGENKFQLMIQTAKGDVKSAIFTTYFNPNTSNTAQTAPPQYSGTKTRRLALVIGNADYVDNNGLKNPVNDATDVAAALREIGFEVMTATNTNLRKMTETMDAFGSKLKNYDVGLFYYAGHGLQVRGENYLVPIDAKPQTEGEVAYDCFPVGKLLAKMEDASNRANIIVLDACRDNPLKRSWSRSTGGGGLANMTAPSGTFIGFATAPGSTAADGTGRNGVFTSALLEHIRKANLSVDQLFNAVNGSVKKLTNNRQIPWKTSSFSEDLYLTR